MIENNRWRSNLDDVLFKGKIKGILIFLFQLVPSFCLLDDARKIFTYHSSDDTRCKVVYSVAQQVLIIEI